MSRDLGIKDIQKDPGQDNNIQKITEGKILRQLDLGELTYDDTRAKRRFAVSAGVGFDAAASALRLMPTAIVASSTCQQLAT